MMPIAGNHHLNMMMYLDDDSFKEAVRLKMLNQEATFRNQVQELHRLYQIQMTLMKNFQLKGVLAKQSVNCTSQGTFQRHLDANFSARVREGHFDQHFLDKRDGRGTRENPVQVENYFPGDTESSLDDVELSLSIGEGTKQKRWQREIFHQTPTSASSREIIDLEESSCTELSGDIKPIFDLGCIAGSADSRDLQVYRSNCFSMNRESKHVAHGVKRSLSFVDECKTHLEQNSLNEGVELFNASVDAALESGHGMHIARKQIELLPDVSISPLTKVFTSHEALCLDLNKPLPDESLFDPKEQPLDLGGGCSDVTERVADDVHKGSSPDATSCSLVVNNCSDEVSAIIERDPLNFEVMASNSNNSSTSSRSGKALSPGNESSSGPSNCCDIHHCLLANSHHKDADQLGSNFTGRSDKGQRVTGVKDDILNDKNAVRMHMCCRADPVEDLNSSPASCKSIIMKIDRSCSLKTMQSGIYLGKADPSLINSSPNSESSQNESSSRDESKSKSLDEKRKGSTPDDFLVRRGAISLMYLFLESSRREHSCITKFDEVNENGKGKRDQPQHSIDTYESMVLKQQESNIDDYCVTSNPPEVIGTDKKDFGVKVRRGRRMKDFQKDILPSLASLSRHEISEDIRIMEGAMRSREYKRLRSKTCCEQKWFTPVKSKRSRLNYVGRKYN
ncbi:OLC1v1029333C1 [Oldenlandia corymbosa var. corymbosa]|uniref:OLC1v1029333C1 n=1 Tax=Oldenlandia corymbosa var. corymbosa TaxID=529605 RepID=A0AAV1CF67_OLDCO|nr:OLC1v1029333C1 [Oldenlandia corymbosa var. corymbosa]